MRTTQLSNIAKFKHGSTPSKSEPSYWNGEIPWASSKDIKSDLLDRTSAYITLEAVEATSVPMAPTGSLLLVVRSGILAHTIPVAVVSCPMAFNQDIAAIIPDSNRIDSTWLRLFIKSQTKQILQNGIKRGATVQSFRSGYLRNLEVPLIPLREQVMMARTISTQLADIHTCCIAAEKQVSDAEGLHKAILRTEFRDGSPIAIREGVTSSDNWRWHKLVDVTCLESGHTPSRRHPEWWGGEVPWLSLTDIRKLDGKFAYDTGECTNEAGLANSSARLLPTHTVCLSRTASVGFVTILGKPMSTSQDFVNWVCDEEKLDPEFLMYAFMASRNYLLELGSGAVHKSIYMPTLYSFHVCAPDITEQRRISRTLRNRLAAAEILAVSLRTRLNDIEQLPQRLLAAAFGEIQ